MLGRKSADCELSLTRLLRNTTVPVAYIIGRSSDAVHDSQLMESWASSDQQPTESWFPRALRLSFYRTLMRWRSWNDSRRNGFRYSTALSEAENLQLGELHVIDADRLTKSAQIDSVIKGVLQLKDLNLPYLSIRTSFLLCP